MSSARRIAANQINGRKGRGPRTAAGKAKISQNAYRHGFAAIHHGNSVERSQIEQMAKAICGHLSDPLLFEQALKIAESEFLLRCVSAECIGVIERLRDGTTIALAKGDNSLAVARARCLEFDRAAEELDRIRARFGVAEWGLLDPLSDRVLEELENQPPQPGWKPTPIPERDELDAVCKALPDLHRLARYQRRAWTRRKRAVRNFIDIARNTTAPG